MPDMTKIVLTDETDISAVIYSLYKEVVYKRESCLTEIRFYKE